MSGGGAFIGVDADGALGKLENVNGTITIFCQPSVTTASEVIAVNIYHFLRELQAEVPVNVRVQGEYAGTRTVGVNIEDSISPLTYDIDTTGSTIGKTVNSFAAGVSFSGKITRQMNWKVISGGLLRSSVTAGIVMRNVTVQDFFNNIHFIVRDTRETNDARGIDSAMSLAGCTMYDFTASVNLSLASPVDYVAGMLLDLEAEGSVMANWGNDG